MIEWGISATAHDASLTVVDGSEILFASQLSNTKYKLFPRFSNPYSETFTEISILIQFEAQYYLRFF